MSSPETASRETTPRQPETIAARKAALRTEAMERRRRLAEAAGGSEAAGAALARHLLERRDLFDNVQCVSAFWPMGEEIDPRPLMTALAERGLEIGLPIVKGRAQPLIFRRWRPGDSLQPGGFGTSVPAPEVPEVAPQLLLVPLLAFDRQGYRLGYGGGFYDRTLQSLRDAASRVAAAPLRAIGVAYAGQEVDTVPRDVFDQPLDAIFTEAGDVMPTSAPATLSSGKAALE